MIENLKNSEEFHEFKKKFATINISNLIIKGDELSNK